MSNREAAAPLVAAYYYPGWHRMPSRIIRGRAGGSEWDLLFDAIGREAFPDVRRPLRGPIEPTVDTLEGECLEARAAGIEAFIWCWYWDHGTLIFNETLDLYRQCRTPSGFKYALMWVNRRPHLTLPLTSPSERQIRDRAVTTDERDFRSMIEHLADLHWSRPDYLFCDSRPLLLLFHVEILLEDLGAAALRGILSIGNEVARHAGYDGVEYVGIVHKPWPIWRSIGAPRTGATAMVPLGRLGFRAVSNYVYLPDWSGPPSQDYRALVGRRASEWTILARQHELPLWPSLSVGWDGRPRGLPSMITERLGYPWTPHVTGETPAEFARALDLWWQFTERQGKVPILPIASWNEWTEGHALAPCDRHDRGMLGALMQFTKTFVPGRDVQP